MKIYFLCIPALVAAAHAQLLDDSVQSGSPATDTAESAAAEATPDERSHEELIRTPSKNVGLDVETYVRSVQSSLDMRNRVLDPFCRYQDPSFKPAPKPTVSRRNANKKEAVKIPFSDYIEKIPVSIINSSEDQFIVGSNTFTSGDTIPLKTAGGEVISITVVSIEADSITFRNDKTSETAMKQLGILPNGMSRGTDFRPQGLIPKSEDRIIDLSR